MLTVLSLLLGGYLLICVLLYFRQESLIFYPTRESEAALQDLARRSGFESWKTSDGKSIGWVSKQGDPSRALLVFHGNAGHALMRSYLASLPDPDGQGWRVYVLEYPGYGAREGETSEKTLVAAGVQAVDELSHSGVKKIWILGESLGTGVASQVAGLRPTLVTGVILLTPFDSLSHAAAAHYPWLPTQWLIRHTFDSAAALKKYPGPVAFLVAGQDSVVPARLGQRLFDERDGPKRLWIAPDADHNDGALLMGNWPEVADWLRQNSISPLLP